MLCKAIEEGGYQGAQVHSDLGDFLTLHNGEPWYTATSKGDVVSEHAGVHHANSRKPSSPFSVEVFWASAQIYVVVFFASWQPKLCSAGLVLKNHLMLAL